MIDDSVAHEARKISDVTLTFVDVETTGLSARSGDRVCEIALIRQKPGAPESAFSTLIDPERAISPGAFRVNQITPEMLRGAPCFADVIDRIAALLSDCVIVAHNAPFDLGFLDAEFERCGRKLEASTVVDTLSIARRQSRFTSCSLAAIATVLGLKNDQAHRAMGDCRVTQQALAAMIRDLFPLPATPLVSDLTSPMPVPRLQQGDVSDLPSDLAVLIQRQKPVSIVYRNAEGNVARHDLNVSGIARSGSRIYLLASWLDRDETRQFRLDRVLSYEPYNGSE